MKSKFIDLLERLCSVPGISGQEQLIARAIKDELCSLGAKVNVDHMGNVSVIIKGKGLAPSMMLIAHTDQVGAIVSQISDSGLILYRTVGCVDKSSLPATRVLVGNIPGTVSAPPAHMASSPDAARSYIDVGAESRDDVLGMGINIGTQITYDTNFTRLGQHRILSHSVDDRVGCAILIMLYDLFKDNTPDGDVILGFCVREETTMAGASMLIDKHKPDWALAVDTVPMRVNPDGKPIIDLGCGPVFQLAEGVISCFAGNFVHPGLIAALISAADEIGAEYQLCAEYGDWTTDGNTINRANGGTPSAYISIPRRNAHSASEIMDIRDAMNSIAIIKNLIISMASVNLDFI